MKKIILNLILLSLLIIIAALSFNYYLSIQKSNLEKNKIKVVTTVGAISLLVKEIGGLRVDIVNLAKGDNVHEINISPREIERIKDAKIIFKIGYGIDDWVDKFAKEKNIEIKELNKDVEIIKKESFTNPHYWFSLKNLKVISKNIFTALVEKDPDYTDYYFRNYQKLLSGFDEIEKRKEIFKNLKYKKVIVTHPAVDYLAKELNLEIVGYLKTEEGKDLLPKDFYELVKKIKKENVKVLIAEKGFITESVVQFSKLYKISRNRPIRGCKY